MLGSLKKKHSGLLMKELPLKQRLSESQKNKKPSVSQKNRLKPKLCDKNRKRPLDKPKLKPRE